MQVRDRLAGGRCSCACQAGEGEDALRVDEASPPACQKDDLEVRYGTAGPKSQNNDMVSIPILMPRVAPGTPCRSAEKKR